MDSIQRKSLAALLILFFSFTVSSAQAVDPAALDAMMNEALKFWQTPGAAVVVVRGDEVVYLKGFGVKDVNSKQSVTPDTVFAIGSTTKAFTTAREMHTPRMVIRLEGRWKLFFPESDTLQLSYGLGWFINDYRGHKLVMHGGTIDGFRASIMLEPKAKIGVAVLANLNGTQMPEATCYNLMDLLLGLPQKDWNGYIGEAAKKFEAEAAREIMQRNAARKKDTKPSRELAAYVGTYEEAAYGKAEVLLLDGKLAILWSNFKSRLDHFHFDTFTAADDRLRNEQAVFSLDANGELSGMNFLGVNFKKAKAKASTQQAGR